ncbi:hypothetical protein BpHYR1_029838 [Brachionus plicatilis]|uniref:Uncharacterized protein n=1 Tax=Brachionus plicatilis TaxID=10195 RepID=A0A3M7PYZ9_BRAPC|nr:hypothetical protein BpHYR1_029838 [Brachionus plicatilis]
MRNETLRVQSSFFATVTDESSDHGVACAPLDLMNKLVGRTQSSLSSGPNFDGSSTADNCVERKRVHYFRLVVHFSLNLPFAYVLVAPFASVLNQNKLTIRTYLFDAHWT